MKNQISSYATVMIIASVLFMASAVPSADAQTTSIRYKGQSADASWYYEQDDVYTNVYVFATNSASRQGSDLYTESVAYVGIYQYRLGNQICDTYDGQEYCWNEYIPLQEYYGYGTINPASFQTQGRLDGATLDAKLDGYNYLADSSKSISVNIDFTGQGDYSSGKSSYLYRSGDYMYNGNYIGLYRQATATGSISGDITMDLGNSTYGTLYSAKSGSVNVSHQ